MNCYLALGRFAKGIITNSLRQYTLLGDTSTMSDGKLGNDDDRWIFPDTGSGVSHAVNLAASARALRGFNDTLATHCVRIAREVFSKAQAAATAGRDRPMDRMQLAVELYLTTGEAQYFDFILSNWDAVVASAGNCAWYMARVEKQMESQGKYVKQCERFRDALLRYRTQLERQSAETPYGVPYRPSIWGAGWDIQSFGYRHYFLAKEYPEISRPTRCWTPCTSSWAGIRAPTRPRSPGAWGPSRPRSATASTGPTGPTSPAGRSPARRSSARIFRN